MSETDWQPPLVGPPAANRRKIIKTVVIAVLVLLLAQSITVTLPINAQVVDGETGQPVRGAQIAALWLLDMASLDSKLPGGAVRISHVTTDEEGRFRLPLTFIVHTPVVPFSLLMRSDSDMPLLVVVAEDYRATMAFNDVFGLDGPPHPSGFMSVRSSSVRNAQIKLMPLRLSSKEDLEQLNAHLSVIETKIREAQSSCQRRATCKSESLSEVRFAIE